MFGFFGRLRERARAAVLLGIADAADDVFGTDPAPADLDRVRALLAASKDAPAIEEKDEPAKTRRK